MKAKDLDENTFALSVHNSYAPQDLQRFPAEILKDMEAKDQEADRLLKKLNLHIVRHMEKNK